MLREIQRVEESLFLQRLESFSDREVIILRSFTLSVATKAAGLLATVAMEMPLYTLHNEQHVLNVISWMERLLGNSAQALSPIECAICVIAAYVHDLGMTLDASERDALKQDPDYRRFLDRAIEEREGALALRRQGEHYRASLIENHLRTEYVRSTHADLFANRMRKRIRTVASEYSYRGFSYRRQLELVAISHNHPVEWFRHQCEKEQLSWRQTVGKTEQVDFARIAILLRLADIMDFDSSRTPTILFRHLGLDAKLASRFEQLSSKEWKKHLAVTGVEWPLHGTLTYHAPNCPDPVTEKSVREFVRLIENEKTQAASELQNLRAEGHFSIELPELVNAEVRPAAVDDAACYEYHDWHFRLDQEEIIQLLMGDALYGDPGLCIRELLQNALDAVELRDLRLQLRKLTGQSAEQSDGELIRPGMIVHEGQEEELGIVLTWGEENGRQYIRIDDNGVGMTEQVVKRYFTQIGKSFYRSSDFRGEQSDMRAQGLIATPISNFGIGILSCFMIADQIQVRTHPGGIDKGRKALDLDVSGPGSLFWTRRGTRNRQGTDITLWLRRQVGGSSIKLEHDRQKCLHWLRGFFDYRKTKYGEKKRDVYSVDPAMIAAQFVIWPKYPVKIFPPRSETWVIDDRFHNRILAPISREAMIQTASGWGYAIPDHENLAWEMFDWVDNEGEGATGSRIRLWIPVHGQTGFDLWELATFVSAQLLPKDVNPRLIFQGMHVENTGKLVSRFHLFPGLGFRIWIDLRGAATPRLTVDRKTALPPKDEEAWNAILKGLSTRYIQFLENRGPQHQSRAALSTWIDSSARQFHSRLPLSPPNVSAFMVGPKSELASASLTLESSRTVSRSENYEIAFEHFNDYMQNRFKYGRDKLLPEVLDYAPRISSLYRIKRAKNLGSIKFNRTEFGRDSTIELASRLCSRNNALESGFFEQVRSSSKRKRLPPSALVTNWLQEAFQPSLAASWPGFGLNGYEGIIGDAILTAPTNFRLEVRGREVLCGDPSGREPSELARFGYDLCFPMTAIPLGELRRTCSAWRTQRFCRVLGTLPFLVPLPKSVLKSESENFLQLFACRKIYALWPAESLWDKPFAQWTPSDWQNTQNKSILWNLSTGDLIVRNGIHSVDAIRSTKLGSAAF